MKIQNSAEKLVSKRFPRLGINKKREISRLLFEISKRDGTPTRKLLQNIRSKTFAGLKSSLLEKRYPSNFSKTPLDRFYLPDFASENNAEAQTGKFRFYPKNIFIEKHLLNDPTAEHICGLFPRSTFVAIDSIKEFTSKNPFSLSGYNKRADNLFLIEEKYDFIKPCPCTSNAVNCGYSLLNAGFGCPLECTYCFLQGYQNLAGIAIPVNLDNFFDKFTGTARKSPVFKEYFRIGTGEFTDSLVFDHITGFSKKIIRFFSSHPEFYFEFKTKTANINNILNCRPQKNIVVSWSINPQRVIDKNEYGAASLKERLLAASECAAAGFGVGFHFDPILYYAGWEKDYLSVIDEIFSMIPREKIYWISLGTLRMPKELKKVIELRFPENTILDSELLLGKDDKLRYHEDLRIEIYRKMVSKIKALSPLAIIYLCMEPKEIWEKCGLGIPAVP